MLTCIVLSGALYASIQFTAPETEVNWDTRQEETVVPTKSYLLPLEDPTILNFTVDERNDETALKLTAVYIDNAESYYWELWVPIEPGTPLTITDFLLTCPKPKVQL